jgi:hypothetical protein
MIASVPPKFTGSEESNWLSSLKVVELFLDGLGLLRSEGLFDGLLRLKVVELFLDGLGLLRSEGLFDGLLRLKDPPPDRPPD